MDILYISVLRLRSWITSRFFVLIAGWKVPIQLLIYQTVIFWSSWGEQEVNDMARTAFLYRHT